MIRKRLLGADAILHSLAQGLPVQLILYDRDDTSEAIQALLAQAAAASIPLWRGGQGDLRRMSPESGRPADAIALLGASPKATLAELMARGGVTWLLHRATYPSNVGFTIRTAEVSGADGVVVDAVDFNRDMRSRASHVTMGADRVMPVLYEGTEQALAAARSAGKRVVAIEDVGAQRPHEVDLTGPLVLLVGNERDGIGRDVLARCDAVVRIPMLGFVPSYSLQAAVSGIAMERLRQLAMAERGG